MKVESFYSPLLVCAQSWESLAEAVERMQFNEVGSLAVYDDGIFAGILTERDVVRAFAERVDPEGATVGDFMTEDPAVVGPATDGREAATIMLELGIRHLPVVVRGRLLGMVSIRDLLQDAAWAAL